MATDNMNNITPALLTKTTHAIVEFNDCGRKSIELVLRSWLSSGKKTGWNCAYPTGANMQFAEDYVRKNKAPEKSWAKHKVRILQEASSYEQGLRRLERWCEGQDLTASTLPDAFLSAAPLGASDDLSTQSPFLDIFNNSDDTVGVNDNEETPVGQKNDNDTQFKPSEIKEVLSGMLSTMEARIKKKMNRMEQNILFEVRQQFKTLMTSVVPDAELKSIGQTLSKCKSTLSVEEVQRQTVEELILLEEMIAADKEKREALKTWMILSQNGARDLKESVSKILSAYIVKNVQLQYSGCGRKIKGEGKRDFSATQAFACMTEVLLDIHHCNKDAIRSMTSKWLSGAGDREGGKKARSVMEVEK